MYTLTHDIIISGAGPAGSALALLLAGKTDRPDRIALVGKSIGTADHASAPAAGDQPDPRTLALNLGSRVLLTQLDSWPEHSADIRTVHVSQRGRLGRTVIDCHDMNVPRLGSVVSYDALLSTLHARLHKCGVDMIASPATSMTLSDGHVVCQADDRQLHAAVGVQSDGRQPQGIHRHYRQDAVLATVRADQPQAGCAYERFTRQGPLALLPHPESDSAYAVVWCCPPERAQYLRSLDRDGFDDALNEHFGDRLGRLRSLGERHVFPLSLHAGPLLINPRTVAIGNAAQTLHPVAGQGLNLGLRDAAQLAFALTPWLAQPSADPALYLNEFVRRRGTDRWLTAGITDFLPRVFSTGNPLVEHGCGLALLALDLLPQARNTLARHLLQGLRA